MNSTELELVISAPFDTIKKPQVFLFLHANKMYILLLGAKFPLGQIADLIWGATIDAGILFDSCVTKITEYAYSQVQNIKHTLILNTVHAFITFRMDYLMCWSLADLLLL